MYLSFFGLQQAPFSIAPDPRYLFMSERHREALAHLLYGVRAGGGFVLLTGEIGAGKTTVCRCFLEQVPDGCQVGYIVNPKLSVAELLQTVAEEFGIAVPDAASATVKTWVDALNRHLLDAHAAGRQCLLIIDEAQHLSAEVLEQLRLLTNLETHERKLLQIILIGQPELRTQLAAPGMEQLAQRVIARYHLQALSAAETVAYVAHRLAVAGLAGANSFDARALARVQGLTGGVPRRINLLCDRALLGAYAQGRGQVDLRTVTQAAREVFGTGETRPRTGPGWAQAALLAAGASALGVAAALMWPAGGADPSTAGPRGGVPAAGASAAAAAPVPAAAASAASPVVAVAAPVVAAPASAAASVPTPGTAPVAGRAASAAPPGVAASALPLFDPAADWASLPVDEAAAVRALALAWGVTLPAGGGCAEATALGLACWRHRGGSLPLLAQLDRPVLLLLSDAPGAGVAKAATAGGGRPVLARLVAQGPDGVVLAAGDRRWRLPTAALATLWRGDLLTLWRLPSRIDPVLAGVAVGVGSGGAAAGLAPGASGPAVAALRRALDRALPPLAGGAASGAASTAASPAVDGSLYDAALRDRVAAFQLQAGLKPDGLAGPTTFMQLNRALAVDEPRLGRE